MQIAGTNATNTFIGLSTSYTLRYDIGATPPALRWSNSGAVMAIRAASQPPHFAGNTVYLVVTMPATLTNNDNFTLLNHWSESDNTNSDSVCLFIFANMLFARQRFTGSVVTTPYGYSLAQTIRSGMAAGQRYVITVQAIGKTNSDYTLRMWVLPQGAATGTLYTATATGTNTSNGEGLLTSPDHNFDLILGATATNGGAATVPAASPLVGTLIHEVRYYSGFHTQTQQTVIETELKTKWAM